MKHYDTNSTSLTCDKLWILHYVFEKVGILVALEAPSLLLQLLFSSSACVNKETTTVF